MTTLFSRLLVYKAMQIDSNGLLFVYVYCYNITNSRYKTDISVSKKVESNKKIRKRAKK